MWIFFLPKATQGVLQKTSSRFSTDARIYWNFPLWEKCLKQWCFRHSGVLRVKQFGELF